ncbi:predicted protein [Sclerotinia sclerotiorum 1980 UF-70]|uniref:Aminoglycoside phosphotransferase domain-containing protein n=2 Tax=Sclerotinia sclerotiorum (strain ATCC 18683 / 1980 / Ss-1) TaxID=665079 RepID=A7EP29_SCLS1|nr:predicted protein [Sclerotinia sclerotiorum 1980 UF-70]APA10433.1 hypothetical protein sscle_06g052030 [Sclerotinia sclerotiorum 1980 UF-70]EDO04595.1 predicted protein [Sclerotinia sclerotiorum 1980 UF-70]
MAQEGPWSESQWFPVHENIHRDWYEYHSFFSEEESDHRWRIRNGTWPLNESIKEIDGERDAWLICNLILRRTEGRSPSADWYDEKDNSSYHITNAPFPPLKATYQQRSTNYYRGTTEQPLVEVLDVRNWLVENTTWSIGYCAVLKMDFIYSSQDYTPQHVTLGAIQGKLDSRRFQVPKVIHHEVQMKRTITFETQIYGLNLGQAWLFLSDENRWRYIAAVADFCFELSKFKGDNIGWATKGLESALSEFCFSHNSCAPDNIILVDGLPEDGIPAGGDSLPAIGIVDWSIAGFVPKAWARTRFAVDMVCDLPLYHRLRKNELSRIPEADAHNFRWGVWKLLGNDSYNMPEVNDLWWKAHPEMAAFVGPEFIQGRRTLPLSFS